MSQEGYNWTPNALIGHVKKGESSLKKLYKMETQMSGLSYKKRQVQKDFCKLIYNSEKNTLTKLSSKNNLRPFAEMIVEELKGGRK